jgi:hypothetical protein
MSILGFPPGLPGIRTNKAAGHRIIFRGGNDYDLPGGKIIDGAKSRDTGNTGNLNILRAGLMMGKITASGKYAPSVIGITAGALSATGTTVTVSAAQAVEIVRRVGATGTLRFVGPPTAAGTVATFTETYSAVNTTTGAITTSGLDADLIAGSFVCANDGTYLPLTFIDDGWGIQVTDIDGTDIDVPFAKVPIQGVVYASQILPAWPSDTSLRAWIRDQVNLAGKFQFDYMYG